MTLQLPFLLDASSDRRVSIWDHGFANRGKNLLNLVKDWGENYAYLISEKIS